MRGYLWLGATLALGSVACSAGSDGSSTIKGDDPATVGDTDAGTNGEDNGGSNGAPPPPPPGGDTGGNGPSDVCEEVTVRADKVIPDILIVLDKSGSMVWPGCAAAGNPFQLGCPNAAPPYNEPFDRWVPSVAALKTTTVTLQERVRFGLMIFPSPAIPGPLPPLTSMGCQPGAVSVTPALNTAMAIGTELDGEVADGDSTPIPGTLRAAHDTLGSALVGPDDAAKPKYVLLVTDGAPNCTVDSQQANTPEQANMQTYAEIDSLREDGIKTYVIGYDTRSTAELAVVMDEMARRGGTGETMHREVTDENSLLDAISAIAGQVTECTFQLDQAPSDLKKVSVVIDGKQIKNDPENGWELTGEKTIELRGMSCDTVRDISVVHTLGIEVKCKDVIIQ